MPDALFDLIHNEMFSGMVGASLVASALYLLRKLPEQLLTIIEHYSVCSVVVYSEDSAYESVNEWLNNLDYTRRCRRLRLTTMYDDDSETERELLVPGQGRHFMIYKGRPIIIGRHEPEKGGLGSWKRFEDIRIQTFGRPQFMRELIDEIKEFRSQRLSGTVSVYMFRHRWRVIARKPRREVESVVLPDGQIESLTADVDWFIGAWRTYVELSVPYRRGYLFEGPPGCGKTSLAMALATHLRLPIYALNLGSISNDDMLIEAVSEVPEKAVLLLEDIDAAKASAKRTQASLAAAQPSTPNAEVPKDEPPQEISLSGLLNVIDGVYAREGRILVMTTNFPEKVDPALLRPGRVDVRMVIGLLGREEGKRLAARFFGDDCESRTAFLSEQSWPCAAAELQEKLIKATVRRRIPGNPSGSDIATHTQVG